MLKTRGTYLAAVLAGAAAVGLLVYSRSGYRRDDPEQEARAEPTAAEPFPFPEDRGGKLLAERLAPAEPTDTPTPGPSPAPRRQERVARQVPAAPLPPIAPELPQPNTGPASRPVRPRLLPEEPPLTRSLPTPVLPEDAKLPASAGVRLPSPRVDEPPAVPILAQHPVERGAPDDPTAAFATLMALAARLPDRLTPVPFLRLVLPDPFPYHRDVRSARQPAEETLPVIVPRLPEK